MNANTNNNNANTNANTPSSKIPTLATLYAHQTYYDQYGGSLFMIAFITLIFVCVLGYVHAMINVQPILEDWPNQRCNPTVLPIAGLIAERPEGVSATEYTAQNFTYCSQTILQNLAGSSLEPLTYLVNAMQDTAKGIQSSIQSVRVMFNKVRNSMQSVTEDIMGRLINVTIPLQQIVLSFRDMIAKIQGTMTASLFTFLGTYYTLKSLMGAIAQFIIAILVSLAIIIAILWCIPFAWGAAAASTATFVAISVPMAIILSFMTNVLHVNPGLRMPSVKCFDGRTGVKLHDGRTVSIQNLHVGDVLWYDNAVVTATIKVLTAGSRMYTLHGIVVSDSHIVQYRDAWIPVHLHPDAVPVQGSEYTEPFLYCLNTSTKTIRIGNTLFTDWDEVYGTTLDRLLASTRTSTATLNATVDCGLCGTTPIRTRDRGTVCLKDIVPGERLDNQAQVYGVVCVDGSAFTETYMYALSPHADEKEKQSQSKVKIQGRIHSLQKLGHTAKPYFRTMYHLLTDKGSFAVGSHCIPDYNEALDTCLEKTKVTK